MGTSYLWKGAWGVREGVPVKVYMILLVSRWQLGRDEGGGVGVLFALIHVKFVLQCRKRQVIQYLSHSFS